MRTREPRAPCWAAHSETGSQRTRKSVTSPDRPPAALHRALELPQRLTPGPHWARKCRFCLMSHLASLPSESDLRQNSEYICLSWWLWTYQWHFLGGNCFLDLPSPFLCFRSASGSLGRGPRDPTGLYLQGPAMTHRVLFRYFPKCF